MGFNSDSNSSISNHQLQCSATKGSLERISALTGKSLRARTAILRKPLHTFRQSGVQ
jgi:hypothetical protein